MIIISHEGWKISEHQSNSFFIQKDYFLGLKDGGYFGHAIQYTDNHSSTSCLKFENFLCTLLWTGCGIWKKSSSSHLVMLWTLTGSSSPSLRTLREKMGTCASYCPVILVLSIRGRSLSRSLPPSPYRCSSFTETTWSSYPFFAWLPEFPWVSPGWKISRTPWDDVGEVDEWCASWSAGYLDVVVEGLLADLAETMDWLRHHLNREWDTIGEAVSLR